MEEKIILLCFGKPVEVPVLYYRKTVKFLYYWNKLFLNTYVLKIVGTDVMDYENLLLS